MGEHGEWGTPQQSTGVYNAMFYCYAKETGPDPEISARCLDEIEHISRSEASRVGGTHTPRIRDGMTQADYNFYRPAEAVPRKLKEIISACDESYHRIGLLRNTIDLMSDFASQGIEIFHKSKVKQARYRHWFRKVGGKERSERFLNLLYRHGNVIIRRSFSDLNAGDMDDLERGIAGRSPDEAEDVPYKRGPRIFKNRIPLQYSFLNPTAIEVIGGDLAVFAGEPRYALKLPEALIKLIKSPKTSEDQRLVQLLPDYITQPVRANKKMIPLNPEKVSIFHYKKDDWFQWAYPMTYSILADLKLYEKNKLADMAALDGAVSHIRLWTLGLPEFQIQPGPKAFERLKEQLRMVAGGGSLDLIWDASLRLQETSTDVYNFLGMKKYEPVLQAIYAGLGLPQALTGGGREGGMAKDALSLKTLIERLQYGRDLLKKFWENELNMLQEAFGDAQPAQIHFENMSLSDEANEKMLWIQLVDRDVISYETLREKFGTIPEVEQARLRREYADRKDDSMPEKSGPFNEPTPNPEASAQKALQTGLLAPSQTKMKVQPKKPGDKTLLDHRKEMDRQKVDLEQAIKSKGRPGQGRPRGKKDQQKRKRKAVTPRVAASLMSTQMWARKTQRTIADTLTPLYLSRCKKNSMRKLTAAQADEFERIKFGILCSLEPGDDLDVEVMAGMMSDFPAPKQDVDDLVKSMVREQTASTGLPPAIEDLREIQVIAYAMANTHEHEHEHAPEENTDDGEDDSDA